MMLSVVLEISVSIREQLKYYLVKRDAIYKYCFANKGEVDIWVIGRSALPFVGKKRNYFRQIYEFLYRKNAWEQPGVSVWKTVERCNDRGSMQEIRERLGMVAEPPHEESVVVKDVLLCEEDMVSTEASDGKRKREEGKEEECKRLKSEEEKDELYLKRLGTLSKLLRCYVKSMFKYGLSYEDVKNLSSCMKDCDSIINEIFLDKYGIPNGQLFRDYKLM